MADKIEIPGPRKTVAFDFGGHAFELKRIPIRRHDWDHRAGKTPEDDDYGHPMEQALMEIWLDGKHVGFASRGHGWGKQGWSIDRVGERYGDWWALGDVRRFHDNNHNALMTPADIAEKVIKLRASEELLDMDESLARIAEYKAAKERREAENEANRIRWKAEREEKERQADQHRQHVLEGLRSIEDRGGLSNHEADALRSAIERYQK